MSTLLLAKAYKLGTGIDVSEYVITEKYDGVRAIWDGTQFITRQGNVINAPEWFTKNFPAPVLDGELWAGNGKFDIASATIRRIIPNDDEWANMLYVVFDDLSDYENGYSMRLDILRADSVDTDYANILIASEYTLVRSEEGLLRLLDTILEAGGEGLMLRRRDSMHPKGRSSELLKLKKTSDAEATVVGYAEGSGKYKGSIGALYVARPDGEVFKIGSGLTDDMRHNPPAIGTVITYKYRDLTKTGLPRFATFYRLYKEI